ncbi:MAG: chromosome segregation protein SMC [Candidatus Omnitrophica bacterium]|nr:chromosome segregation protein SMC [Candidatus Omnitrophota bacterium]
MYFKRLEVFGFKSFAEKTKLKFEPGVTAIVGPNGCGKSNIADAIKWVLGEQSAKELRGARMEDVIFNGTANSEPINVAEVSIVLDNTDKLLPIDFDEVIITRKLFRSGESQYFLNKNIVRLKDINELLAGTGMGTSSYSMIEQGKIGLICSSKPEERRNLFEEASGITKYKVKKKEALRKLEHTEQNLLRINDIVSEVERQIKSIERQARKAEKYKVDFDVLKDLDLKHASFVYKNILSQTRTLSIEEQDLKRSEEETSMKHLQLKDQVDEAKKAIDKVNERIQELRTKISETESAIDKNGYTMNMDRERIAELLISAETAASEIEYLKKKNEAKLKDMEQFEERVSIIEKQKEEKTFSLTILEKNASDIVLEIDNFQNRIKQSKSEVMNIVDLQTKTKNELIKIGADLQARRARLSRLRNEQDEVEKEQNVFDTKMHDISQKHEIARKQVNENKEKLNGLRTALEGLLKALSDLRYEISVKRGAIDVLRSKRDMLAELAQKHEGFGTAVKAIIEKCQSDPTNIEPRLLADVISVDTGYEQAVESFLGSLKNAVIVDRKEDADFLIDFLRQENIGRVNFLILGEVPLMDVSSDDIDDCSSILKHVKSPEQYVKLLKYIFRDTYICENAFVADKMFEKFNDRSFVTKNSYLRQGPRIFDGAVIEADFSVIGRKEKVKELENTINEMGLAVERMLASEIEKEAETREYKEKIDISDNELRQTERVFANAESERQALLDNMKRIDDEKQVISSEVFEEKSGIEELTKRGEDLNVQLNEVEQQHNSMQSLILSSEQDIKEKVSQKEATLLQMAEIRGALASIQIRYDNMNENLNLRKEECREIQQNVKEKEELINTAQKRSEELSDEILQLEADKHALSESLKQINSERDDAIIQKNNEILSYNEKEKILTSYEQNIQKFKDNIRDVSIKEKELSYKKEAIIERIQQRYKEDIANLQVEIDDSTDWDQVKEQIQQLEEKLERMGTVNLIAIEEHRELEERFSFLSRQRDDLVNAKESLLKAIQKINATTKKLFIETFEKVRDEFKNYFRMLFGGGQAEIFLMDEKDVLECGIEIVVRPPGKKLQNIMLLSGGEKALTAIALMFAIFKINPSPFCVLDEIDAPLDEINVDRFSNVLQEFLKISQFIIITHNKKTMQMVDALYGVTMPQRGISRIVSVKLSEAKTDKELDEVLV